MTSKFPSHYTAHGANDHRPNDANRASILHPEINVKLMLTTKPYAKVDGWRYTAWLPWDSNTTSAVWVYPPFGEELYEHPLESTAEPGISGDTSSFDATETVNVIAIGGSVVHRKVSNQSNALFLSGSGVFVTCIAMLLTRVWCQT